jgi:hypothetical protein
VNLCAFYFYKLIGKLTAFFQLEEFSLVAQHDRGQFHFRRTAPSSQLKSKVGNIRTKATVSSTLLIGLL